MQGFERADRQFLDAAALAGHLVLAGSIFAFLAAHRAEVFPSLITRTYLPAGSEAAVAPGHADDCGDDLTGVAWLLRPGGSTAPWIPRSWPMR
jgi:hypothetical protein